MASIHTTYHAPRRHHDWERIGARILMTVWGVPIAISGAFILISLAISTEGADISSVLGLGITFLIASVPAFVAWRSERLGGRLLVAAGVFIAVAVAIIQYTGIQHGVMRNGAGEVNPWWIYGLGDVLFGLPPFVAGLLLLDHLRRQEKR